MKPEVRALLHKAQESVQAAELLNREGYSDFAASRAYYAMFYTASALLLERDQAYSSHSAVIAAFGKQFARGSELDPKFHRYLIDAQDSRNLGDYGIDFVVSEEQGLELIQWAREFLMAAEEYLRR